ncbi:MAG: ABC transporter permease [Chthonomonadaceae bacterium]|nr:ABC transporter permease [Chthonomonadaceae bacterium]
MLGVIIGVASVSMIIEVKNGFTHFLTDEIKKLGSDTIIVFFNPSELKGEGLGSVGKMTMDDVSFIRDRATKVELASGILLIQGRPVKRNDNELKDPRVIATDQNQAQLSLVATVQGRHMTLEDVRSMSNVCLIGNEVAAKLFPEGEPLGGVVNFSGLTLEVVGVMDRVDIMGQSNGKDIWMPISTAQKKWLGGDAISYVTCRPKPGYTVQQGMDNVWEALMAKSGNKPVYRVDSRESIVNVFGTILGVAGAVLAGIAALSLLVGGIGIMNIMLVSVTERTREIGLRKAVGAHRSAILVQFLVESAFLSIVGGLIGMAIAWLVGQGVTAVTIATKFPTKNGLNMAFDPATALFAVSFSALIGVIFGIYPAARASQLSPIEALRSE